MKAPDKIYIHRTIHLGLLSAAEIDVTGSDVEYIRKDFLIDKLARAKALREKSGSKDTEIFDALINLIKEL